jgi:TetR/AcrR family transcriptional regulator
MQKISRKEQILQVLVSMLEHSQGQVITTANLAKEVGVSEAALYRHFPSKFKMYESLLDFMDESVFSRINRILQDEVGESEKCEKVCWLVLTFAEKNPGLSRLLYGDVLVGEREQLRLRTTQFYERISLQLRQVLREAEAQGGPRFSSTPGATAGLLIAVLEGKVSQYARSGFKVMPTQGWTDQWSALQTGLFSPKTSAF